jgi:hypothetical protein
MRYNALLACFSLRPLPTQTIPEGHHVCDHLNDFKNMEIKALVLYRDAYALYLISSDDHNIFTANLKRYDGNMHNLPPPCVTLTKSVRCWKGSTDEQELVDELGEIIHINLQSGINFRAKDKDANAVDEVG